MRSLIFPAKTSVKVANTKKVIGIIYLKTAISAQSSRHIPIKTGRRMARIEWKIWEILMGYERTKMRSRKFGLMFWVQVSRLLAKPKTL